MDTRVFLRSITFYIVFFIEKGLIHESDINIHRNYDTTILRFLP